MTYVLPVAFVLIFLYSLIKNIPAYDHFIKGAKESFSLVLSIFPYLVAIFIFVELLDASGVSLWLSNVLSPVFNFFGIPKELSKLIILRPFSGSGSLAILKDIYITHGPDSFVGTCASVVVGASDTVFYVVSVYFSTIKITNLKYLLPVCLIACFFGSVASCFFVKLLLF